MSRFTNTLGRVRVAAPCEEDWDEMRGDERVRFCSRCSLNVYNLSALTRREAERLVLGAEGRLCIRFYRRGDGTILTQNCPTGLIKLKRRVSRVASATAAAAVGLFSGVALAPEAKQSPPSEAAVTFTPLESDAPSAPEAWAVSGSADFSGEKNYTAEAFGGMELDPAPPFFGWFGAFGFVSAIVTLLTWPLIKFGDLDEEERREELRIWSNEWSQPDESASLPREGSAVDSESVNAPAPRSTLPLEV